MFQQFLNVINETTDKNKVSLLAKHPTWGHVSPVRSLTQSFPGYWPLLFIVNLPGVPMSASTVLCISFVFLFKELSELLTTSITVEHSVVEWASCASMQKTLPSNVLTHAQPSR